MKIKKNLPLILVLIFAIAACKKSGQNPVANSASDVDVYSCGAVTDNTLVYYAALWKNGVPLKLSNNPSYALAISYYNKDIYVAGYENNKACYWKNGNLISLDGADRSLARAITIHGNDIYVAGWYENGTEEKAAYWKNGIMTKLSSDSPNSGANGIAIQGNDIYVAGLYSTNTIQPVACYWKNGVITPLINNVYSSMANGIAINGKDVYIALYLTDTTVTRYSVSAYWKNGVITKLTNGESSYATGITISNNDVYISGGSGYPLNISYWKNGNGVAVPNLYSSSAIAINGNDVYLGGGISNSTDNFAAYWKNGALIRLEQTRISYVTGIALVPK